MKIINKCIFSILVIIANMQLCFAIPYCGDQLSPADKVCKIQCGKTYIIVKSNQAYNLMQLNAVYNVVPLKFQEKMLFSNEYYQRVRFCKTKYKGGDYCYSKYYNNTLKEKNKIGKGKHVIRMTIGVMILLLFIGLIFSF